MTEPEQVDDWTLPLLQAAGEGAQAWNWRDSSGSFLAALDMEDDVMFVILSVLVLIASMNITSGLIMLVKNKGRDIGILRTMGLTEGAVLRVFFLCGAFTGVIGTIAGVVLGVLLAYGFAGPLGARLKQINTHDQQIFHSIKQVIIASLHGYPQPLVLEAARSGLPAAHRPKLTDLLDMMRGR